MTIHNTSDTPALVWIGKVAAAESAKKKSVFVFRADIQNSKYFYDTNNIYIAGDNLEAIKLLRNGYTGRIKMIYICPPSGTVNLNKEYEWLNMMYPRLLIASALLAENGIIFINLDSNKLHRLIPVLEEIFDKKNFIAQFVWKPRKQSRQQLGDANGHIICYAKNAAKFIAGSIPNISDTEYPHLDETKQQRYKLRILRKWGANCRRTDRENLYYPITAPDNTHILPIMKNGEDGCWRWNREKLQRELTAGTVAFIKNNEEWQVYEKVYEKKTDTRKDGSDDKELKKLFNSKAFNASKPEELLRRLLGAANTADGDIILDFFAGLSTTAHAVMKQNADDGIKRRFILIQIPENTEQESEAYKAGFRDICELGIEKLNRAADLISNSNAQYKNDIDKGYKLFKIVSPQKMPL